MRSEKGFTLVEVLIASAVSVLLVLGIGSLTMSVFKNKVSTEGKTELNEVLVQIFKVVSDQELCKNAFRDASSQNIQINTGAAGVKYSIQSVLQMNKTTQTQISSLISVGQKIGDLTISTLEFERIQTFADFDYPLGPDTPYARELHRINIQATREGRAVYQPFDTEAIYLYILLDKTTRRIAYCSAGDEFTSQIAVNAGNVVTKEITVSSEETFDNAGAGTGGVTKSSTFSSTEWKACFLTNHNYRTGRGMASCTISQGASFWQMYIREQVYGNTIDCSMRCIK